ERPAPAHEGGEERQHEDGDADPELHAAPQQALGERAPGPAPVRVGVVAGGGGGGGDPPPGGRRGGGAGGGGGGGPRPARPPGPGSRAAGWRASRGSSGGPPASR